MMNRRCALLIALLVTSGSAGALSPITGPTLFEVVPAIVSPSRAQTVSLYGTNFVAPVRVFLRSGSQSIEVPVISATSTRVDIIAMPLDLGEQQRKRFDVILTSGVGTSSETTTSKSITYQLDVLTPDVVAISPNEGPLSGYTRITILGEGFQEPLQLFAGGQEIKVIQVLFDQVMALMPPGEEPGRVTITVFNPVTGKSAALDDAFNYLGPHPHPGREPRDHSQ